MTTSAYLNLVENNSKILKLQIIFLKVFALFAPFLCALNSPSLQEESFGWETALKTEIFLFTVSDGSLFA